MAKCGIFFHNKGFSFPSFFPPHSSFRCHHAAVICTATAGPRFPSSAIDFPLMSACRFRKFVMHFMNSGGLGSDQKCGRPFSHACVSRSFSSLAICSAETRRAPRPVAQCFYLVCNTKIHLNFMSAETQTFIWEQPLTPGRVVGYHLLPLSCGP